MVTSILREFRDRSARCRTISMNYFEFLFMEQHKTITDVPETLSCLMSQWSNHPHLFRALCRSWMTPNTLIKCDDDCLTVGNSALRLVTNRSDPEVGRKAELIGYALNWLHPFVPYFPYTVYGFESTPLRTTHGSPMYFGEADSSSHNLILEDYSTRTLGEFVLHKSVSDQEVIIVLFLIMSALDLARRTIAFSHHNLTSDTVMVKTLPRVTFLPVCELSNKTPLIDQSGAGFLSDSIRENSKLTSVKSRYCPQIVNYTHARAQVTNHHIVYSSENMRQNPRNDIATLITSLDLSKRHKLQTFLNEIPRLNSFRQIMDYLDVPRHNKLEVKAKSKDPSGPASIIIRSFEDLDVLTRETGTGHPSNWKIVNGALHTQFTYKASVWTFEFHLLTLVEQSFSMVKQWVNVDRGDKQRVMYNKEMIDFQLHMIRKYVELFEDVIEPSKKDSILKQINKIKL